MNLIQPLLQFHAQLKVWHWQTTSFARHNAFGDAYEAIEDPIDSLVEAAIGRYGREALNGVVLNVKGQVDDRTVIGIITEFKQYLDGLGAEFRTASDLLNLRDDILGHVDQLLYRLTLA